MQFVYTPEGGERLSWPFDPMKLTSPEAMAIEKLTGMAFGTEWIESVQKGSISAIHALLFVMLKRQRPQLKPDQVVFAFEEVGLEADEDELEAAEAANEDGAQGADPQAAASGPSTT